MMGSKTPTEVLVVVHHDGTDRNARRVSIDGDASKACWIAKSLTESFHLTGKTTRATGRNGQTVVLPMANMVIPEWLAADREFI